MTLVGLKGVASGLGLRGIGETLLVAGHDILLTTCIRGVSEDSIDTVNELDVDVDGVGKENGSRYARLPSDMQVQAVQFVQRAGLVI